jgi:hypothetical protein
LLSSSCGKLLNYIPLIKKVYFNDANDVKNTRSITNVTKAVNTIEKAAFMPPTEKNL